MAVGRQRLRVNLVSLITAPREKGPLPIRAVQWYVRTVYRLHVNVGTIVRSTRGAAGRALPQLGVVLDRIRASPVVHTGETGRRQNGANGSHTVLDLHQPPAWDFTCRGRNQDVVDEALGESLSEALVSDYYVVCNPYPGLKRWCWARLLWDIHDFRALYSKDTKLARRADEVHRLRQRDMDFTHPKAKQHWSAQEGF